MRIKIFQKLIDKLRRKNTLTRKIRSCNDIQVPESIIKRIKIDIKGKNNRLIIKSKTIKGNIIVNIFGNNNEIIFDENVHLSSSLRIIMGQNHPNFGEVNNSRFFIGKNTSIESLKYTTFNSNTFCEIEEDCMLSYGITLYNTDGHPIFNKDTKEIVNKVKGIKIGKHSWIGMNVTILKNSNIPSNSIIGCNAVFAGECTKQSHCIFAGNPARVVKENVDWDANGSNGYVQNI